MHNSQQPPIRAIPASKTHLRGNQIMCRRCSEKNSLVCFPDNGTGVLRLGIVEEIFHVYLNEEGKLGIWQEQTFIAIKAYAELQGKELTTRNPFLEYNDFGARICSNVLEESLIIVRASKDERASDHGLNPAIRRRWTDCSYVFKVAK